MSQHNEKEAQERQWIESLREGDESALQRIFNAYYPILVASTHRIVRDEESCKDLAQDVFVELWRKRAELDIRISLRAYLRRAALNRALNFLKSQKRYRFTDEDDEFETGETINPFEKDHHEHRENLESALHRAIQNLPEKCRVVFSLSRFEHLSHKEIAAQLDISVKTIENQITKAIKSLRESLLNHPDLSAIGILLWNLLAGK